MILYILRTMNALIGLAFPPERTISAIEAAVAAV